MKTLKKVNYKKDRQKAKQRLKTLQGYILELLRKEKPLRQIYNRNALIITVWAEYDMDAPADSITRLTRHLQAKYPHLDTKNNQKIRANREVAHREYLKR